MIKPAQENPPDFSILIGRVSTEDEDRVLETLQVLREQQGSHSYEVIIADRNNDSVSALIDSEYPEIVRIEAARGVSLPRLRTMGLEQARGTYIIVTEDHCVPSKNWLDSFVRAFETADNDVVAVGGCVENAVSETALDWATFLCKYSYFLAPVTEGYSDVLPGMNVAYKRSIFESVDPDVLTSGFWETTLHPLLVKRGRRLYSTTDIVLFHAKAFSLKLFLQQRFIYSRYYAGLRYPRSEKAKRLVTCAATLALPPLLLYRSIIQIKSKKRLSREFIAASPYLFLFYLVWSAGEMYGYLFGPGDSLARIE